MSRSARSILTLITGISTSIITLLVSLIATRLVLRWLGQERLGAFRASSDWAGYLGLLELGLGGALLPMLADAMGRGDLHHARRVLAVAFRAYRYVALAMLLGGCLLVGLIPHLIRARPTLAGDLRLGVGIGLLGLAFVPLSPLRSLLDATQRGYIVHATLFIQSLLITFASMLLAYVDWGITGQWLAIIVGGAVFNAMLILATWHRVPNMRRLILRPSESIAAAPLASPQGITPADVTVPESAATLPMDPHARMWQLNWPTLVLNIASRVGLLTDSVMLALFLGPAIVVPFQLTQRLAQTVLSQLQSVGNSTWAALAELHVNGEHELFVRRLMDLTRLTLILGMAAMGPIVAFDGSFVSRWVGAEQYGGLIVNILAAVNGLSLAIYSLWSWAFSGTGRIASLVPMGLTSGIVNVLISAICTKWLGITGPLWGTLAALVLINSWWMPLLLRRDFQVPLRSILSALAAPLALGLPYAGLLWFMAHRWPPHTWIMIATGMAASALSYLALAWWLLLSWGERKSWIERVIKIRGAHR